MEFLFLSAIIHFIILFFVLDNRLDYKHLLGLNEEERPVEVTIIDGSNYRQIIGLDDNYAGDKEENRDARYLGKVNRRVDRESQAKLWGRPKNRMPRVQYIVQQDLEKSIGEYLNKKKNHPTNMQRNKKDSGDDYGDSTNYDYLPGVASGDYTILNTAEFIYFSFYKRVEDAVVYLWNRYVTEFIRTRPDVRDNLGKMDYITEVEAVLDSNGNFVSMSVTRSAGVAGLDDAPGKAFMEASPFEHPPTGMIGDDGMVRMKWRFIVSIVESLNLKVQEIDPNDYTGHPDPALERQMR